MSTYRRLLIVFALLGLVFSGCSSGGHRAAAPSGDTIVIKNFAFSPRTITVSPGATVTVRNEDQATHTVTATGEAFHTGDIPGGGTTSFRAPSKPGRYPYICGIHQYMTGTLDVS